MRELKAKERETGSPPASAFSPRSEPQRKKRKIIYPESDGKPMADNTKQFSWIVKIKENLERMFADRPDVFVAGDLLWYPVEGNNRIRTAPDAMVAFGRPKGHRGSYRTWDENGISPQAVFEILSPGNRKIEMDRKHKFYEKYGVQEYYLYDPDRNRLSGWIRSDSKLVPIENMQCWISPLLKIRFDLKEDDLHIFDPDGEQFLTPLESALQYREKVQSESQRAEKERLRAEKEQLRAEKERLRAEKERLRAESADRQAKEERIRAEKLAAKLRELGIRPDQL